MTREGFPVTWVAPTRFCVYVASEGAWGKETESETCTPTGGGERVGNETSGREDGGGGGR